MKIGDMPNLGPRMERWLSEIGIDSDAELRRTGAVDAWRRLRFRFGREITLNALYAMAAALIGCDWRDLPADEKGRLRHAVEDVLTPPD
jgi:DNA transformation protein